MCPKPVLSVVSPCYGAPELVAPLVDRLVAALAPVTPDFEILLVNDACPRGSWAEIEKACAREPRVIGLNLSRNFGQHYAITAGLDHARGEWTVVMDCDLQDQPEEIPKLLARAREGFEVVFARRAERQDSLLKTLPGDVFGWLMTWLTGVKGDRAIANFSLIARPVVQAFRQFRERDRAYAMIVHQLGFRRAYVDVAHAARPSGRSAYTLRKLVDFAIQNIVAASTRPLRLSIRLGLTIAAASVAFAVFLVARYFLHGIGVPGWTSLAVLISFFFGLLFMQLGVIGLYLGKTFDEVKRRPLYLVAHTLNAPPPPGATEHADQRARLL
jgi:dolichol-phosphate mannosyltransferase